MRKFDQYDSHSDSFLGTGGVDCQVYYINRNNKIHDFKLATTKSMYRENYGKEPCIDVGRRMYCLVVSLDEVLFFNLTHFLF